MMWIAGAGGVAAIVVILSLAFSRSSLAKRLGEKEKECEVLERKLAVLLEGAEARVAAEPTLEQLSLL